MCFGSCLAFLAQENLDADLARIEVDRSGSPGSPTPDPSPTWASRIEWSPEGLVGLRSMRFFFGTSRLQQLRQNLARFPVQCAIHHPRRRCRLRIDLDYLRAGLLRVGNEARRRVNQG